MDDNKSLEQQASEDLAELEAEEQPCKCGTTATKLDRLAAEIQTLKDEGDYWENKLVVELEAFKRAHGTLIRDLGVLKEAHSILANDIATLLMRVDRLDPSFNQHNCPKCGAKIINARGKCNVCR